MILGRLQENFVRNKFILYLTTNRGMLLLEYKLIKRKKIPWEQEVYIDS